MARGPAERLPLRGKGSSPAEPGGTVATDENQQRLQAGAALSQCATTSSPTTSPADEHAHRQRERTRHADAVPVADDPARSEKPTEAPAAMAGVCPQSARSSRRAR